MARRSHPRAVVLVIFSLAAMATAALGFSGGAEGMPLSLGHAQLRVEDDASSSLEEEEEAAAAAYPRRRALYSGGHIDYGALTASKAACYGPCPARGQAYSRGCLAIYQCRG